MRRPLWATVLCTVLAPLWLPVLLLWMAIEKTCRDTEKGTKMGTESWRQIRDTCDACGTVWEGPVGSPEKREFIRFYEGCCPYNEAERETVERTFCSWDCVGKYAAGRQGEERQGEKRFTGPTVELTPELLEGMRDHCKKMVEKDGGCNGLLCQNCPGFSRFNHDVHCLDTGWAAESDTFSPNPVAKASAERFLAEHPMQEEG